jgi:hypothetical protein
MNIKGKWQVLMLHLLTHILLFLASISQPTKNETANTGDLLVLLSFKSFITSDPTQALSSWYWDCAGNGTNTKVPDFCNSMGVTCSDRRHPGRVSTIRLQGLSLVGTICPQLSNLTRLRVLNLSANNLEGEIPLTIGHCAALHAVDLGVTSLAPCLLLWVSCQSSHFLTSAITI